MALLTFSEQMCINKRDCIKSANNSNTKADKRTLTLNTACIVELSFVFHLRLSQLRILSLSHFAYIYIKHLIDYIVKCY